MVGCGGIEMELTEVYVGLGGNIGNTYRIMKETLNIIKNHPMIFNLKPSRLYKTSPVSPLPQEDYLNAVCRFQTTLGPHQLLNVLQEIENKLGKRPKPKEAPRIIDCDILFFGHLSLSTPELKIPHPLWRERLFVLAPLSELVEELWISELSESISVQAELQMFENRHHEKIYPLEECLK
jgi:2-amino-4-hydroxy-6-hydroxymethyldihydropteridine diphosphokinase